MNTLKFMLDSMIFDEIISHKGHRELLINLVNSQKIQLNITHIQISELSRTADNNPQKRERREHLLVTCFELCNRILAPAPWVIGFARVDQMYLGKQPTTFDLVQKGNIDHTEDAMIGDSARHYGCDFLVTQEKSFSNKMRAAYPNLPVINYDEFIEKVKLL